MRVNLPVPFVTQQGAPLEYNPNDCSQASIAGIVNAYTGSNLSALDVALATGTNDNKPQSMASVVRQGAVYGIELNIRSSPNAIPAWYRAMLNDGKPVIALCDYFYLPKPGDFPHFLIVKGYDTDSGSFILNDPYQTNGADWEVTEAQFNAAISSARYNYPYQAIYPTEVLPVTKGGMNLDILNLPTGAPNPSKLAGIPYARIPYNVAEATGGDSSTDLNAAYQRYAPYFEALKIAGIAPILVLTHQTYGQGRDYVWEQMSDALWEQFINEWIAFLVNVVHQWTGKGFVYQIWNEQDTPPGHGRAAVPMPAAQYGKLFKRAYTTIKGIDTTAKVITGGHVQGAGDVVAYFRATGITQTDGVGLHPYGQGVPSSPPNLRPFGLITSYLDTIKAGISLPLLVTEFGILDQPNVPLNQAIDYARDMVAVFNSKGVKAANWYAYGYMDNGFPVVDAGGNVKIDSAGRTLLDPFKSDDSTDETLQRPTRLNSLIGTANARATANGAVLGSLVRGDVFVSAGVAKKEGNYTWTKGTSEKFGECWIATLDKFGKPVAWDVRLTP